MYLTLDQAQKCPSSLFLNGKELIPSPYNQVRFRAAQRVRKALFPSFRGLPSWSCPTVVLSPPLWLHRTTCRDPKAVSGTQRYSMNVPWWMPREGQNPLLPPWNGVRLFCLSVFSCHCTHFRDHGTQTRERKGAPKANHSPAVARQRPWGHGMFCWS